MRWRLIFISLVYWLAAAPVAAQVTLRAIYPNPPGSDEGEWIAVENLDSASASAETYSLRDTAGSVKTYQLAALGPGELRIVAATQSGITLNNTGEAVELLAGAMVAQRSPDYVASAEGKVWLQLLTSWQEVDLAEYLDRAANRRWGQAVAVDQETVEPVPVVPTAVVVNPPTKSPLADAPANRPIRERRLPQLKPPVTTPSPVPPIAWPAPPEPEYESEMAVFLGWKREALAGSLALVFAGLSLLLLAVPPLDRVWRWLRDELML